MAAFINFAPSCLNHHCPCHPGSSHSPVSDSTRLPFLCRFLDAGMTPSPRAVAAGVQKAPFGTKRKSRNGGVISEAGGTPAAPADRPQPPLTVAHVRNGLNTDAGYSVTKVCLGLPAIKLWLIRHVRLTIESRRLRLQAPSRSIL